MPELILILSVYNVFPYKRSYFDSGTDMKNEMVMQSERPDRFVQIMRELHFADNTKICKDDRLCRLCPLISHIQNRLIECFISEKILPMMNS